MACMLNILLCTSSWYVSDPLHVCVCVWVSIVLCSSFAIFSSWVSPMFLVWLQFFCRSLALTTVYCSLTINSCESKTMRSEKKNRTHDDDDGERRVGNQVRCDSFGLTYRHSSTKTEFIRKHLFLFASLSNRSHFHVWMISCEALTFLPRITASILSH